MSSSSSVYCRTTSCLDDPQKTALDALLSGNMRLLSDLLAEESIMMDTEKQYPEQGNKTLLHIAVENKNTEAVRILLAGGAQLGQFNSVLKLTVLHLAAGQGDEGVLTTLLRCSGPHAIQVVNIKDRAGRTPLHLAALGGHIQCVKILLEAGANANVTDNKGGQTPLTLAANKGNIEVVKLLLKYGADLRGDAESVITSNFSGHQIALLDLDSVKRRQTEENITEKLYKMIDIAELDGEDVVKFRQLISKATSSDLDSIIGKMSMIQACAERGLASYVSLLLTGGADPNITTIMKPTSAFLLAAAGGKADVVKVMLDHNSLNSNNNSIKMVETLLFDQQFNQTVLHQLLRKPLNNLELSKQKFVNTDYEKCFEILLKKQNNLTSIINIQDSHGNTALHYATQFWDNDTVTKLLLLGANIGLRNNLGETPISNILPSTMESYLNQHCIKSQGNPTNEDFKISFHYDFLAPPRDESTDVIRMSDSEDMANKKTSPQPETDVLWYMAKSKDHCHLLKHPVITSFLALKWSRISFHYNTNMIFSTLLVVMLTLYIFTNYAGKMYNILILFNNSCS